MDSDKNSVMLEKQLRILAQKIRIDILKKLNNSLVPLSYSMLQKEIMDINQSNINLSFHLKTLKKSKLIKSIEEGYCLTNLGKKILNSIISMEQIINAQNKTIMIRTSKYSKEPFNITKIEEYLIKEGEMEIFLAKQIAHEVEERLSKTSIDYLTAPLMREYINAILLENGLEEVRHKLTRLGTPPYEVSKLFEDGSINPKQFLKRLGRDVSEQFLLLNLLPNELADLYLSGEIAFLNLSYWSLRPLGFYITSESIINFIKRKYSLEVNNLLNIKQCYDLILKYFDVLSIFKPYFSEDIVLGNFNENFLSRFNFQDDKNDLIKLLINQFIKSSSHFTLEFSCNPMHHLEKQIFTDLSSLINSKNQNQVPLFLLNYSSRINFDFFNLDLIQKLKENLIFYNANSSLLNSTIINTKSNKICNFDNNKIILDKILINLHSIALQSNQNDDIFYDILHQRLNQLFEIYNIKKEIINKKLKPINTWNNIIRNFFNENGENWVENSIKSVSFFGLNMAIKTHCGIELDRIKTSERFALNIISYMKSLIEERIQDNNDNYILTQPHEDEYLYNSWNNNYLGGNFKGYSMNIIRPESNLPLEKQISIFKNFEKRLDGGSIFSYYLNKDESSIKPMLENFSASKLTAFNFK